MHFLLAVYLLGQFEVAKPLRLSSSHYDSTLRVLSLQALTPWKEAVFTPYSTRLLRFIINNWIWTNIYSLKRNCSTNEPCLQVYWDVRVQSLHALLTYRIQHTSMSFIFARLLNLISRLQLYTTRWTDSLKLLPLIMLKPAEADSIKLLSAKLKPYDYP